MAQLGPGAAPGHGDKKRRSRWKGHRGEKVSAGKWHQTEGFLLRKNSDKKKEGHYRVKGKGEISERGASSGKPRISFGIKMGAR